MAGRSIKEMVEDARVLLQDTRSPFRYRQSELVTNLNSALMQARRLRPDLFIGRFGKEDFAYTADRLEEPFPLPAWYSEAFVEYMVGRAELRDDEFTNEGRAIALMNRFSSKLQAMGA